MEETIMENTETSQSYEAEPQDAARQSVAPPPRYPAGEKRRRGYPYKSPALACFLSIIPGIFFIGNIPGYIANGSPLISAGMTDKNGLAAF